LEGKYITVNKLTVKQEKLAQEELTQRTAYTHSSDEVDWTLINEVSRGSDDTLKLDNKGAPDMIIQHLGTYPDQIDISAFNKSGEATVVSPTLPDADLKLIEMMMSNRRTRPVVDI